jgi:hypothetical protein
LVMNCFSLCGRCLCLHCLSNITLQDIGVLVVSYFVLRFEIHQSMLSWLLGLLLSFVILTGLPLWVFCASPLAAFSVLSLFCTLGLSTLIWHWYVPSGHVHLAF